MKSLNQRREQLLMRRAELDTRLHEIDDELETHQSKDWAELATERESDEVLEGMGRAGQTELVLIAAALARLDAGDYGFCGKCGEAIGEERLDLLPYTPFCRSCAS
ncbi:TraR/DksA family transcriptional regulator [Celeribacter marinus]|uniref:TraR/DksA family transcriptional regulator n=1 Tax=Celeribacter marinus TaxID=1397108 RepID=UPI003F6AF2FB